MAIWGNNMPTRGLLVIAHNRPRYLRLTLEGLARCEEFDKWELCVAIDGVAREKPDDFNSWLPNLPMRIFWRENNIGILRNTVESIKYLFDTNLYDSIMWVEDDMLVRPDILKVAKTYKYPSLVSFREKGISMVRYTPPPNLIGKDTFNILYEWIQARKYVGLWDARRDRPIPEDESGHDCVVGAWIHDYNITVCREPKSYVLHFGLRGKNQGQEPTDEARRLEADIFDGKPSGWIENLLRVFKQLDGSDPIHKIMYPKDFSYEV
jgi:hypothetical protein